MSEICGFEPFGDSNRNGGNARFGAAEYQNLGVGLGRKGEFFRARKYLGVAGQLLATQLEQHPDDPGAVCGMVSAARDMGVVYVRQGLKNDFDEPKQNFDDVAMGLEWVRKGLAWADSQRGVNTRIEQGASHSVLYRVLAGVDFLYGKPIFRGVPDEDMAALFTGGESPVGGFDVGSQVSRRAAINCLGAVAGELLGKRTHLYYRASHLAAQARVARARGATGASDLLSTGIGEVLCSDASSLPERARALRTLGRAAFDCRSIRAARAAATGWNGF